MSAYGAIQRAYTGDGLPSTVWYSSSKTKYATIHHLTLQTAKPLDGLIEYLHQVFAEEVDGGKSYPQEGPIDLAAFENYSLPPTFSWRLWERWSTLTNSKNLRSHL